MTLIIFYLSMSITQLWIASILTVRMGNVGIYLLIVSIMSLVRLMNASTRYYGLYVDSWFTLTAILFALDALIIFVFLIYLHNRCHTNRYI